MIKIAKHGKIRLAALVAVFYVLRLALEDVDDAYGRDASFSGYQWMWSYSKE